MNISQDVIWEILLVLGGIVFGKLWQHEGKLNKRVTYEHCTKNRDKCPCIKDIDELNERMNSLSSENNRNKEA